MIVRKQKYFHGGVHPNGDDRIPPSQRQREEVPYDPIYNPSGGVLGGNFLEQARQQVADITFPYAFGPYGAVRGEARVGDVLGIGSDFTPLLSDAKEAARIGQDIDEGNYLDAAIGAGLFLIPGAFASKAGPYIKKGAERVMNFLRPKGDEVLDAAVGLGQIRNEPNIHKLELMLPKQMQEGLDETNVVLRERLDDFFSEEGQRRAKEQLVDQVKYYDELSKASDEYLARLGFQPQNIPVFRKHMEKFRNSAGEIDPDSPAILMALQQQNQSMRGLVNRTGEVVQRAEMDQQTVTAIQELRKRRDAAMDAGDYQRVADLEDLIDQTQQAFMARQLQVAGDMRNAIYQRGVAGMPNTIKMNREYLGSRDAARIASIHELQHGMADIPIELLPKSTQVLLPRTVEADRILDDLVLIDPKNRSIKTPKSDPVWGDLAYFADDEAGRLNERSPFLAEMREDMLEKGFISSRHDVVDDAMVDRYLKDYYSGKNVSRPTTDFDTGRIRILEIMDPNTGPYNRDVLKRALNKMLVAVPAVGAAGVAAGTSADDGSSYYKGGKLKLKKEKRYGMRVV